jgi:hypothetical protein
MVMNSDAAVNARGHQPTSDEKRWMAGHRAIERDGLQGLVRAAVAVLLATAAGAATPLTFGIVEGSARFGSALDVRVPLTLDHRAEALAPCVQVDLWYGRSQRDPASVRSDVQIVGKTGGSVRVRSAAPVDQPVVTLGVSTTCGIRSVRQYVLVAEGLPADFRASQQPDLQPAVVAAPETPVVAAAPALAAPAVSSIDAASAATPVKRVESAQPTQPVTRVQVPAARPVAVAAAPLPASPARLARTEALAPSVAPVAPTPPIDPPRTDAADAGPRLRLTPLLALAPAAATEADRAHARAVWRVLQTDVDVLARQAPVEQAWPWPWSLRRSLHRRRPFRHRRSRSRSPCRPRSSQPRPPHQRPCRRPAAPLDVPRCGTASPPASTRRWSFGPW